MNSARGSKRRHQRRVCRHCNELLSYSAYRSHRALYYVESDQRWLGVCSDNDTGPPADSAIVSDDTITDYSTESMASPDHSDTGNVRYIMLTGQA